MNSPERYRVPLSTDSFMAALEAGVGDREKIRRSPLREVTQRLHNTFPPRVNERVAGEYDPARLHEAVQALEQKLGKPPYYGEYPTREAGQMEVRSRLPQAFLEGLRRRDAHIEEDYINAYGALTTARLVRAGLTERVAKAKRPPSILEAEQLLYTRQLGANEKIDLIVQHWAHPVQPLQVGASLFEAHRQLALAVAEPVPYWIFRRTASMHQSEIATEEDVGRFQSRILPPASGVLLDISMDASPCATPPLPGASSQESGKKSRHSLLPAWHVSVDRGGYTHTTEIPADDALVVSGAQSAMLLLSKHALDKDIVVVGNDGLWSAFCAQSLQHNMTATTEHTAIVNGQTIVVSAEKSPNLFDHSDMRAAQLMHAAMQVWGNDAYIDSAAMNLRELRSKIATMESAV